MTNFLDRLVGRAVDAPARRPVRPRARSRFEPPPPARRSAAARAEREPAAFDEQQTTAPSPSGDQVSRHRTRTVEVDPQAGTDVAVQLTHPALPDPIVLTGAALLTATVSEIRFLLGATVPAGTLMVGVLVTRTGPPIPTNVAVLEIAPRITSALPLNAVRDGAGIVDLSIDLAPPVAAGQPAFLLVGSQQVPPPSTFTPPASTVPFSFAIDPGSYVIRLRVGGVDSDFVDRSVTPPLFDADQRLVVT